VLLYEGGIILQVMIELPKEVVAFQGEEQIQGDVQLSYSLWLVRTGRITVGKAAALAGLDIYRFMSICKDNSIPVIDYDRDELKQAMEG
jgi:predicted HTH domain antitoxin